MRGSSRFLNRLIRMSSCDFIKIIHLRLGLGLEANDNIEDGGRDSQCVRLGESERREDGTKRGGHREQDGARAEYCGGEQKALVEYVE